MPEVPARKYQSRRKITNDAVYFDIGKMISKKRGFVKAANAKLRNIHVAEVLILGEYPAGYQACAYLPQDASSERIFHTGKTQRRNDGVRRCDAVAGQ